MQSNALACPHQPLPTPTLGRQGCPGLQSIALSRDCHAIGAGGVAAAAGGAVGAANGDGDVGDDALGVTDRGVFLAWA